MRTNKTLSKITALVLCVALMLSGMPLTAFAEESPPLSIADPTGGSSIDNGVLPETLISEITTPEAEKPVGRETEKEENSPKIQMFTLFSEPTLDLTVTHTTKGDLEAEIDAALAVLSADYTDVKKSPLQAQHSWILTTAVRLRKI